MKKIIKLVLLLFFTFGFCQNYELKNTIFIKYYNYINLAEMNIVDNKLEKAFENYQKAFEIVEKPNGKDLYNCMLVSLNLKKIKEGKKFYNTLKCMHYQFKDDFKVNNFPEINAKYSESCSLKIDFEYKNKLDSLLVIDQKYRVLSKGKYENYQKEITKNDSLVSTQLQKLIQEKGFPNEYNIGLESAGTNLFFKFYIMIWHQLKSNIYSPQVVNFSDEIVKALDNGKITPENAAFILELLNNNNKYNSRYFDINEFVTKRDDGTTLYEQAMNKTALKECCFVTDPFFPEKRTEQMRKIVYDIDENRKKIGLCTIDELIRKKIFSLDNNDYIFQEFSIHGIATEDQKSIDYLKSKMVKIK